MRVAYADPPYPGQAKRLYGKHPDYAGEVDHAELIARLEREFPDGWALSTGAFALQHVLGLCPPAVRVASWHVTNAKPPGAMGTWWWAWEPVIFRTSREPLTPVRNTAAIPAPSGVLNGALTGQKPPEFCVWVFNLLGLSPDDELVDMFPGSEAVSKAWAAFARQLPLPEGRAASRTQKERERSRQPGQASLEDFLAREDSRIHTATCEEKSPGAV